MQSNSWYGERRGEWCEQNRACEALSRSGYFGPCVGPRRLRGDVQEEQQDVEEEQQDAEEGQKELEQEEQEVRQEQQDVQEARDVQQEEHPQDPQRDKEKNEEQ